MDKFYTQYKNNQVIKSEYLNNQYEKHFGGIFRFKENVDARYIEQREPDYKNNLFIEALPPIYSMEEIIEKLERKPSYKEKEREYDDIFRINAILRLKNFISVVSKHYEIYQQLALSIRGGYDTKSLGLPIFIKNIMGKSGVVNEDWLNNGMQNLQVLIKGDGAPMWGFPIIGISGIGKTTAIDIILALFPQCIIHKEYKGHKFLFRQLVWIKIDCTNSASIKGICRQFFEEVDKVLKDTEYLRKFGGEKRTEQEMIDGMETVVNNHALGTLIIDEIQHLDTSTSVKGASTLNGEGNAKIQKVLNSLVTMQNKLKLPIIFIGTYKALNNILSKSYRQIRRVSGIQDIIWGHMEKDDDWEGFINEMWEFQFVKKKSPLTDEIRECLYENSMGISDRVKKLYMATQLDAIVNEYEEVTVEAINKVAVEKMLLTAPMINALRSGDPKQLALFDDIYPKIDIDDLVASAKRDIKYKKELKEVKNSELYKSHVTKKRLIDELVIAMDEIGIEEKNAVKIAEDVIKEQGINQDLNFLKKHVGKKIRELNSNDKRNSTVKKNNVQTKKIIKNKEDISAEIYDDFKNKNIIKSLKDDFE